VKEKQVLEFRLSGQTKDIFLKIKRDKGLTDEEALQLVINDFFEKKLARR